MYGPPYLHILLGVVLKHHKFLENAAHELDEKVASQPDTFFVTIRYVIEEIWSTVGSGL